MGQDELDKMVNDWPFRKSIFPDPRPQPTRPNADELCHILGGFLADTNDPDPYDNPDDWDSDDFNEELDSDECPHCGQPWSEHFNDRGNATNPPEDICPGALDWPRGLRLIDPDGDDDW